MSVSKLPQKSRRGISLTIKISALLVFAVVIPLIITVVGSELILRPTLLSQAASEMQNDAQSHMQTINSYFISRSQEVGSLGQFLAIRKYLAGDNAYRNQANNELRLGAGLDPNYTIWTLFDTRGNLRLSYPTNPSPRGNHLIEPDIPTKLNGTSKTVFSDVYFDNAKNQAFIDIYASITGTDGRSLGIARATLSLDSVWTAVNSELNGGNGNFAMIVDGHGVRIAYSNNDATLTTRPPALFKAIAPLSPEFQQRIADENLYGNAQSAVQVVADPGIANAIEGPTTTAFQATPALKKEAYQISHASGQIVPWTYLVLRPVSTITKAADQQDLYLVLIAVIVTALAASIGLLFGQGIARPILRSVTALRDNSQSLKTLAAREQSTATEQKWIIESSQVGLQSVQYYTEATRVAAQTLDEITKDLSKNWERVPPHIAKQRLGEMTQTTGYIERAATHQDKSSKSLGVAIRVTTQVTEQLVAGATSATEAADKLDEIVEQLRQVVGR